MKKEIKEMEHIAAQEHFSECKKCQDLVDEAIILALQQERERIIEEIENRIKSRLKYCQQQNGLPYCKNCGLCEEDLETISVKANIETTATESNAGNSFIG